MCDNFASVRGVLRILARHTERPMLGPLSHPQRRLRLEIDSGVWVDFGHTAEFVGLSRADLFWDVCGEDSGRCQDAFSVNVETEGARYHYLFPRSSSGRHASTRFHMRALFAHLRCFNPAHGKASRACAVLRCWRPRPVTLGVFVPSLIVVGDRGSGVEGRLAASAVYDFPDRTMLKPCGSRAGVGCVWEVALPWRARSWMGDPRPRHLV